ncbi:MAG TPA: hypothetical protein VF395_01950 [Polyangiaceae bacterium]
MAKRKTSYLWLTVASGAAALPGCGGSSDAGVGNSGLPEQHCDSGACPPPVQGTTGGATSTGPCGGHVCGVVAVPAGTGGLPGPCNGGPCGVVVHPPATGGAPGGGAPGTGSAPGAGGIEGSGGVTGTGPCGGHVCGVIVHPPDGGISVGGFGGVPFPGLIVHPGSGGAAG